MSKPLQIYGYWRSQATYRIRVALALKSIPYNEIPIDLDAGAQHSPSFLAINPLGAVPALLIDDASEPLTQSLAILEYLEESYPTTPALLPSNALDRARVRSLAAIAVSDSHPLIVPRVRNYLKQAAGFSPEQWKAWQGVFLGDAIRGFESRLMGDARTGRFCHGDRVTMADVCLCGLVMSCRAFGIVVDDCPTVDRIVAACDAIEAFRAARPEMQADFPHRK